MWNDSAQPRHHLVFGDQCGSTSRLRLGFWCLGVREVLRSPLLQRRFDKQAETTFPLQSRGWGNSLFGLILSWWRSPGPLRENRPSQDGLAVGVRLGFRPFLFNFVRRIFSQFRNFLLHPDHQVRGPLQGPKSLLQRRFGPS